MSFHNQDWQVVFTKAAFQMKLPFAVQLVENVDKEFLENSNVCTYLLSNIDVARTHLGADAYFAKPMLERIMRQNGQIVPGQTLQFTRPQVLTASSSETVMNTALRFAFVTLEKEEVFVEETETEAERIAREEEEELQALIEEEEREKEAEAQRQREADELAEKERLEAAEKERLENEQKEREAEAQRLKEAEAQQTPPASEQTEDDQFDEEQR